MATVLAVRGIENTTPAFQRGVLDMTDRIGGNPDYWLAVMSFETIGTFDPAIRNPKSNAVGLIQFTTGAAKLVGKTRDELGAMSAIDQLKYVEKYLKPATGKFDTLADHYMAVFAPIGMGKPDNFVLYQTGDAYEMNKGLDTNPHDHKITVGEAASRVQAIVDNATGRIEVPDIEGPGPTAGEVGGGLGALFGLLLFILGIRKFKQVGRNAK